MKNLCRTILIASTFSILVQSCWTTESGIHDEQALVDKFMVIEDENNKEAGSTLVLNQQEEFFQTLVERCVEIHFDSTTLYVKSIKHSFDTISTYTEIKILSPTTAEKSARFSKENITGPEFRKKTTSCKHCDRRKYSQIERRKPT